MCTEFPTDWDKYVAPLLFAYREVPQESLGFAPFELLYGRTVMGPLRILRELWTKDVNDPDVKSTYQYVLELKERLEDTCKLAHDQLRASKLRQRKQYNKTAKERNLNVGGKVMVLLPTKNNKLQLQWKGPYSIVDKVGLLDYKIDIAGKIKTFHANMLKEYVERQHVSTLDAKIGVLECASISILEETYENSEDGLQDLKDDNPLMLVHLEATETISDVNIAEDITRDKRVQINTLLEEFKDVLTDLPGRTTLATHEIKTTTDEPIRVKPYQVPYKVVETVKTEIDKMLAMDIMESSEAEYSSPIVLVRKKDGGCRFCTDYRLLNKITIFDAEPMPSADDLFVKLAGLSIAATMKNHRRK